MLISHIQIKLTDTTLKNRILPVFKILVGLIVIWYLFEVVEKRLYQPVIMPVVSAKVVWTLTLVLLLVPVNWTLEGLKWNCLIKENSLKLSMVQILRGLALNLALPFTTGDVVSRMGDFKNPGKRAFYIAFSRAVSLTVTILFGLYGITAYFHFHQQLNLKELIATLPWVYVFLILLVLLVREPYRKFTLLGVLRYMVFFSQYFLLIRLFNPDLKLMIIIYGISWVFLVKSLLPGILGSIGIREASAVYFFFFWVKDPLLIITPSLIIWLSNIILPSLVGAGLFFIQKKI